MNKPFFTDRDCDLNTKDLDLEFLKTAFPTKYISLSRANAIYEKRIQEQGTVMFGGGHTNRWTELKYDSDTHRALLINIEPIERDSERKILEDLVREYESSKQIPNFNEFYKRVKTVLAK